MEVVTGIVAYLIGLLVVTLWLSRTWLTDQSTRGARFAFPQRLAISAIIAWLWWSVGITLIPLDRFAAWFEFGGILVSFLTLGILVLVSIRMYLSVGGRHAQ